MNTIRVGKNGLTEGSIEEINLHLKKFKEVKVKFLSNFIKGKDKNSLVEELSKKTRSSAKRIGYVVTLKRA
jgi:RNA-binding protein YhbY